MELDNYIINKIDGAWYVIDTWTGEPVSPPMQSRQAAYDLALECEKLSKPERRKLRIGKRPAPGCGWLLPRGEAW